MDPLVIGIGNLDRGDDAVGVLLTRSLPAGRTKEVDDCTTLLDVWDGEDHVIVVDATRSGADPGVVRRFDAAIEALPAKTFPSTHSFGLAEAVELGRALGRLPSRIVIYGIEAGLFDHGQRLTAAVRDAIPGLIKEIEEEMA